MGLVAFIYLVSFLGALKFILKVILLVGFGFLVFFMISFLVTLGEIGEASSGIKSTLSKVVKYYLLSMGISMFLFVIIPSEKVMYAMFAVNVGEDIYKSETAQKGIELLDLKLDQLIKETKEQISK